MNNEPDSTCDDCIYLLFDRCVRAEKCEDHSEFQSTGSKT